MLRKIFAPAHGRLPRTFSLTAMNPFFVQVYFYFLFLIFIGSGTNPHLDQFGRSYLGARFIEQVGSNEDKDCTG